jgi:gamma-polyglutamate synthase
MHTLLPCLVLFLLYLTWERIALTRARKRIPIRIAVTGTRGKSGVARILASILKEDGRKVVAKTTGSEAVILLPDGSSIELDRSLTPSILEQKNLVHRTVRLKAECLVAEVMSLRPENHFVESRLLLKPNIVAITNVRRDHTEVMGETEEKIASVLSLDICPGSTVFVPSSECREAFRTEARERSATLVQVPAGFSASLMKHGPEDNRLEFEENLDLVCAITVHLGVKTENILEGIQKSLHDIGKLKVWRHPERNLYMVNAFAANDPDSTFQVLTKVTGMIPAAGNRIIGILNLRSDRLPRTVQWIKVLRGGEQARFLRLLVIGDHSRVIQRRLPEAQVLKGKAPEQIMNLACSQAPESSILFGFGNVKGLGRLLVEHWERMGKPFEPGH